MREYPMMMMMMITSFSLDISGTLMMSQRQLPAHGHGGYQP
jgi:hypothetical protein